LLAAARMRIWNTAPEGSIHTGSSWCRRLGKNLALDIHFVGGAGALRTLTLVHAKKTLFSPPRAERATERACHLTSERVLIYF
jgi:hypothetical protein